MLGDKFRINILKICRDTASDAVWHHVIKSIDVKIFNDFVYRQEIHNF